jgi:hypothetical protein
MPDPFQCSIALLASLLASSFAVAGSQWVLRARTHRLANPIGIFALAAGLVAGLSVLRFELTWPPANAINRFLAIVLPGAVVVELISGLTVTTMVPVRHVKSVGLLSVVALILRFGLFAAVGRILLHNSVYLSSTSGSADEITNWLSAALLIVGVVLPGVTWNLLRNVADRDVPASIVVSLSMSIMTAGLAIMLAGYIRGGVAAIPVSASLMGTVAISPWIFRGSRAWHDQYFAGIMGVGLIALYGLLWIGYFFGQLTAVNSIVIFVAPLLCWISELPVFREMTGRRKVVLRLMVVAIPLLMLLLCAKQTFDQKLAPLMADSSLFPSEI